MQNISGVLYGYLQSVQAYIAPPITAVFLLGIFHKRINSQGALTTLVVGLVVAMLRIGLELAKDSLGTDGILYSIAAMNFLSFAAWFFVFCIALCITVSLLTPAPSLANTQGLTYSSLTDEQKAANRNSYNFWDVAFSLIVIGIVVFVMVSFTG
jgi:solute:Na+ symporter, SSS family